jgi:hypothetical protein
MLWQPFLNCNYIEYILRGEKEFLGRPSRREHEFGQAPIYLAGGS